MKALLKKIEAIPFSDDDFRGFTHWMSVFAAGGLIVSGVANAVLAMREATVTLRDSGGSTELGTVEGVVVKLSDPTLLDRFMAALPEVPAIIWLCLTLVYILTSKAPRMNRENKTKTSVKLVFSFMVGAILIALSPLVTETVTLSYFDTKVVANSGSTSSLMVVAALTLLFLDSIVAKTEWGKEHERADELDMKMQDVV